MHQNITIPLTASLKLELDQPSNELLALLQRIQSDVTVQAAKPAPQGNTPPPHGEYWPGQGGYYICTLPALLGLPARHLIAGKEQAKATFGSYEEVSDCSSPIDGPANTKALLAHGSHPAAQWASAYTADGHQDFHLPAKLDLVMAHICAPHLFDKKGYYWTSTQNSRYYAFVQGFEYGYSDWSLKGHELRVRAFRRIPLELLTA